MRPEQYASYTVYNGMTNTISEMTAEEIAHHGREPFIDLTIGWAPVLATGKKIGRTYGYMAGKPIFERTQPADTLYSLQLGAVDLLTPKNKKSPSLDILRTLHYPGEVFGTEIFYRQPQHRYTAIARSPCQIVQMGFNDMMTLFMENSDNAKRFRFQLLQQVIMQENVIGDMTVEQAYRSVTEGIAGIIKNKAVKGTASVTQDDLARELHTTRNYINRLITQLKQDNIISSHYGKVHIIDADRLDILAYGE